MDAVGTRITTLSPILPERMGMLTNRLRVVRYTPGLGRPLLQLGFIHYARWIVIDGLPATGAGGWRGLRWKYLLFESNYDGGEEDYLRTFADIVPERIAKLWDACVGFQTSTQPAGGANGGGLLPGAFRAFVERNKLEILDHYAAYPEASTIDVRQAIGMNELSADATHRAGGGHPTTAQTRQVSQMALGPLPAPLVLRERFQSIFDPWKSAVRGQYGVNPLTIVTPLCRDGEAALRHEIRSRKGLLGGLEQTETHFARLVIIPPRLMDLGQPDPDDLGTSYLVFTSDSWGTSHTHIEAIRTKLAAALDLIWGTCRDYPGDHDKVRFHAWVNSHTLSTRYYVAGYPPRPVSQINDYLERRDKVADTYASAQSPKVSELRAALESQPTERSSGGRR